MRCTYGFTVTSQVIDFCGGWVYNILSDSPKLTFVPGRNRNVGVLVSGSTIRIMRCHLV